MRKRICILLPVLVVIGLAVGCGEDEASKPSITRLYVSDACGVAPLQVDFRGDAAGGEPLSEPSGSNNWLKFTWDFGDGTVIDNGTSIAYHQYDAAGEYLATLTAEDDAGERASRSIVIDVREDSLTIAGFSRVGDTVTDVVKTCEPVTFEITADACDFDPVNDTTDRYVHRWSLFRIVPPGPEELSADTVLTATFREPRPVHFFDPDDIFEQLITLQIEDPVRSITREDSFTVTVIESEGADLSLSASWILTDPEADGTLYQREVQDSIEILTVSFVLTNDGPETAYLLETQGRLDGFAGLTHQGGEADHGSYHHDGDVADTWQWSVDELAPGTSAQLDITFMLEQPNVGDEFEFTATTAPYACDPDDDDLAVTAVLEYVEP